MRNFIIWSWCKDKFLHHYWKVTVSDCQESGFCGKIWNHHRPFSKHPGLSVAPHCFPLRFIRSVASTQWKYYPKYHPTPHKKSPLATRRKKKKKNTSSLTSCITKQHNPSQLRHNKKTWLTPGKRLSFGEVARTSKEFLKKKKARSCLCSWFVMFSYLFNYICIYGVAITALQIPAGID